MVDPPPLLRPVEGPVVSRFSYDRATPFRPGRRRVVRFSVPPGAPVRAPCRGRVSHAGRVPGARGGGVSVRCGPWSATLTGVDPGVPRGRSVRRGLVVARATAAPVGLGLRRTADPFGYVDPLPLLRDPAPARPPVAVGPAPRARPPVPVAAPAARPAPVGAPAEEPAPAGAPTSGPVPVPGLPRVPEPVARPADVPVERPGTPAIAWIGLALAALGVPVGSLGIGLRRRALQVRRARARHAER